LPILDAIEASGYNTLERIARAHEVDESSSLLGGALASRSILARGARNRRPQPAVFHAQQSAGAKVSREMRRPAGFRREIAATPRSRVLRGMQSHRARLAQQLLSRVFRPAKPKRNALCALYAFMRLVDDVSDEPGDLESKRRGLARWRAMLDEAVAGRTSGHAVLPALADTIARFEIPTRYFHDLILGAEMDLTVASYATFDRLSEYCYRVAGTVGLTCLHVFGFRDPKAPDLAERLGLAFQLTNIIRDVRGDYEMGRVYHPAGRSRSLRLPRRRFARSAHAAASRAFSNSRPSAPGVFTKKARRWCARSMPDSRATLWALIRTYSTLLARIEERGFDVFRRAFRSRARKKFNFSCTAGMSGWWKKDALAKRSGDRRRSGGPVLRRRAG
jgi:phytoene synthase